VIVDYLDVFGTRSGPPEHDPPLIIDAYRVLTRQIALESFKAVAGRRIQGLKKGRGVYHNQFSASYLGEICRETLRDHAALKDRPGKFALEAPDHCNTYLIGIRIARLSYPEEILRARRVPAELKARAELKETAEPDNSLQQA
jgi:hypothetical protein